MRRLGTLLSLAALFSLLLAAGSLAQETGRHQGRAGAVHHEVQTASDLIGTKVENQQGENLGSVVDLLVDPQTGHVQYVVLSRGGVLGVGSKLYPVPWQVARYSDQGDRFILNMTEDALAAAPNFTRESWPDLSSGQWRQRIQSFYQGQGTGGSQGMGGTHDGAARFDAGRQQTVTGTVSNIRMSKTQPNVQEVTINTDNDQAVVVELAPPGFLHSQNIDLETGDHVTIRGSMSSQAGQDHLVATQLRTENGQQVQLRSSQGQPLWRGQAQQGQGGSQGQFRDQSGEHGQMQQDGDSGLSGGMSRAQVSDFDDGNQAAGGRLVRISQLMDRSLQNSQGQRLASIDNLAIDLSSGKVRYVIVGTGGVLGVGEKRHAIPWEAVNYNPTRRALSLNATKDKIDNAPSFSGDNWPNMSDPAWQSQVNRYFGIQGYEGGQPSPLRGEPGQGGGQLEQEY